MSEIIVLGEKIDTKEITAIWEKDKHDLQEFGFDVKTVVK